MNDDWRLKIDPREEGHAGQLVDHLDSRGLEHDVRDAFHDRIIVSHEGSEVFLYAATREQLESAGELVNSLAKQHGWKLSTELRHWHPAAEEWEDPGKPLPDNDRALKAEHAEEIAAEDKQVREQGYPNFEVRVECPSHHDAMHFRQQLREEGFYSIARDGQGEEPRLLLMEQSVTRAVHQAVACAGLICESAGYVGAVDIGVAVLHIEHAAAASLAQGWNPGPVFGAPDFRRHSRVLASSLSDPRGLTGDLLAPLFEAISVRGYDPYAESLLGDSEGGGSSEI